MKSIIYLILGLFLIGCTSEEKVPSELIESDQIKKEDSLVVDKSQLVEIKGNVYTEYYPNHKDIKFQGTQDEEGRRHGKWLFFSENGDELSMTMYEHGNKHGHSIVKYPNGGIHYLGEYKNNIQVGEWKTYTIDGQMYERKDYGYPQ